MTAAEFAELVQARPTGRMRWQARCPAHEDQRPSLSIQEGQAERVLVWCWAGCSLALILNALNLKPQDLFSSTSLSPEARREAAKIRVRRQDLLAEKADVERQLGDISRRVDLAVTVLSRKVAYNPDRGDLATLLHTAINWRRTAQEAFGGHA